MKTRLSQKLLAAMVLATLGGWLALGRTTTLAAEAATASTAGAGSDADHELAKKLANPVASLISVPFQGNFDNGIGRDGRGSKFTLNIQPVIPFSLSKDWNIISRTILPVIYQSHVVANNTQGGLGDTLQSLFLSPKEPVGGVIVGFGPALLLPTATDDRLGGEQWAAGPTIVALKQSGGGTYGVLMNSLWSYAGDDGRDQVKSTYLQPFLSYTTKTAMTFSLNTESTYNWDADKDPWSIPVNLLVAQLIKVGQQRVQLRGGLRYWAETPDNGPSGWGFRFEVTLLFPK